MKYFTMLILTYNDGKDLKKSVYDYNNLDSAIANFHKNLGGYAYGEKSDIHSVMSVVIDGKGAQLESEYWEAEAVEEVVEETTTEETTAE